MVEQPRVSRKYIIEAVEEVLDAFDDFEGYFPLGRVEVEAVSVDEAIKRGRKIFQERVYEERRGQTSHGTFTACVKTVLDEHNKVLYKANLNRSW